MDVLSLQPSCCDSPKLRSSGGGLGQDPASCFGSSTGRYKGSESPGSCWGGRCVAFIPLHGGRGPWAVLAAEETMERKALISPVMDTLLLTGGADGRNWGPGAQDFLLLSFVN